MSDDLTVLDPEGGASRGDLLREYLSDLVYGANDGIITTFAVVSGVAGASMDPIVAIVLGIANLFADGFSMGASAFLAIRTDEAARSARGLPPERPFPARHGSATFVAFVLVGCIPLFPYAFSPPESRFVVAIVVTLATLFVVGALRATVTRLRWWVAGLEMLTVGAIAAAVAYVVGLLVAQLM